MASFVLSFFPLDVLDEIWDLIESVSEGFLTFSCRDSPACFWSSPLNLKSKNTCMVFFLSRIISRFNGEKTVKQMKEAAFFFNLLTSRMRLDVNR